MAFCRGKNEKKWVVCHFPKPMNQVKFMVEQRVVDFMESVAVQQFNYGITRQYIEAGKIVVVTSQGDMSREAIDCWTDVILDTMKDWEVGKPLLALIDLSSKRQGYNQHGQRRAEDIRRALRPEIPTYAAIVLSDNVIHRLFSTMFYRLWRQEKTSTLRIFTERDKAMSWLHSNMAQP